jgi:lipopolysaccharide transport system permease protein
VRHYNHCFGFAVLVIVRNRLWSVRIRHVLLVNEGTCTKNYLNLLTVLVGREIQQRYRGTWLGLLWALLAPALMLSVYALIFRSVFSARWPVPKNLAGDMLDIIGFISEERLFALNLFAGLIVLTSFGDLIGRSPRLVTEQPQLVKRVVFPLPLLGYVATASVIFHMFVQWAVLALGTTLIVSMSVCSFQGDILKIANEFSTCDLSIIKELLIWRLPLTLLVLMTLTPFLLGVAWLFAALGTYFRDLALLAPSIVTFLMFLSPVFYPSEVLPGALQQWLAFNPLTIPIEQFRKVLFWGGSPQWELLLLYFFVGTVFAFFAQWVFVRVQPGFADVL